MQWIEAREIVNQALGIHPPASEAVPVAQQKATT